MTEPPNNLESRLAGLRPRPLSAGVEPRMAIAAARVRTGRATAGFFWGMVAGGAVAACFIVAMFVSQAAGPMRLAPTIVSTTNPPDGSQPLTALARVDVRWGDDALINDRLSR